MMRKMIGSIVLSILLLTALSSNETMGDRAGEESMVRFVPLNVCIDAGQHGLAAYQFELKTVSGQVKIVGVEGGEHEAYAEPPYYDPAALAQDRIIIGAFNTGKNLPHGRTRVTTLHLQVIGETEPEYEIELSVAVDSQGRTIDATIVIEKGESK